MAGMLGTADIIWQRASSMSYLPQAGRGAKSRLTFGTAMCRRASKPSAGHAVLVVIEQRTSIVALFTSIDVILPTKDRRL